MHETALQSISHAATRLLMLVALLAGGCARYHDFAAFVHEPPPLVTSTEYVLAPPDAIQILSKRVREINGIRQDIRPDGKINLPLLGTVFVAGQTVEQVAQRLEEMSRTFYEDADVSVSVIAFRSKKVYVFGEVFSPGPYPYDGAMTVLELMAVAQPTRLADADRIHVLRPSPDGKLRKRMTINLDAMVKLGDTTLSAVLEENDIIYVPPHALAAVGLTLQQLLLPIQPMAATVSGPANIAADLQTRPYRTSTTN